MRLLMEVFTFLFVAVLVQILKNENLVFICSENAPTDIHFCYS